MSFISRERALRTFNELVDRDYSVALVAHGPTNNTYKEDGTRRYPQRYWLQAESLYSYSSERKSDRVAELLAYLNANGLAWEITGSTEKRALASGLVIKIGEKVGS